MMTERNPAGRWPGRMNAAITAAESRDADTLRAAAAGMSAEGADALGHAVLATLTSDRDQWAWVANRWPWSHWREAARAWRAQLDREAGARNRPVRERTA